MRFQPTLKVLSDDQIYRVHQAALQMLMDPGVLVKSAEARKLLAQAGAQVDEETMICRIPGYIVEESMRNAPSSFTVYGRDAKHDVHVSTTNVHIEPMIGRINCYDAATGGTHPTNIQDVADLIKIADAMPNYHLPHSGAIMPQIDGIPIRATHVNGYLASARNTTKPVKATSRERIMAEDCLRMVSVVAGGEAVLKRRPCTFTTDNPVAPLHHDRDQVDGALLYAQYGIPIDVTSEPQAGATAPVTIAGLLAQQTADVISGITIIQLKNPGNPVWYGTCGSIMDMRVGRIAIGAVEMGLINVASAQIAHFYDVPCRGTASATDSKELDFQAGYEKTAVMTMAVLGGVNKIFYPGTMEGALTVSKEGLVLDNEIAGAIYRALDGVDVVDDTLGVQIAQKVGPGGHYLNQKHTMQFIRQEHFMPMLADRQIRERWEQSGKKNMVAKAQEQVKKILAEHEVAPLPENVEEELMRIVREVEAREQKREEKQS